MNWHSVNQHSGNRHSANRYSANWHSVKRHSVKWHILMHEHQIRSTKYQSNPVSKCQLKHRLKQRTCAPRPTTVTLNTKEVAILFYNFLHNFVLCFEPNLAIKHENQQSCQLFVRFRKGSSKIARMRLHLCAVFNLRAKFSF